MEEKSKQGEIWVIYSFEWGESISELCGSGVLVCRCEGACPSAGSMTPSFLLKASTDMFTLMIETGMNSFFIPNV